MKGSITHLSRALALWIAGACQAATLTVRPGDDLWIRVAREAWQVAEIQKALLEADAGDFATDEEVAALDLKWGRHAR